MNSKHQFRNKISDCNMKNIIYPAISGLVFTLVPHIAFSEGLNTSKEYVINTAAIPNAFFDPMVYLGIFIAVIVVTVLIVQSIAIGAITEQLRGEKIKVHEESYLKPEHKRISVWSKLMKAMTRTVPVEREADVMLDHDYDGIKELDNRLPPWWLWGFYVTIVFSLIYMVAYHITGTWKLQDEEYLAEVKKAETEKEIRIKSGQNLVTAESVVFLDDQLSLSSGKKLYDNFCVACHGTAGQGGVGPNLVDDFWIHGGGVKNIFKVIEQGVPSKGMISWKSQLSPKQMQELSSYLMTFKGTNPPDQKAPQGELWISESSKIDSMASVKI
ncbi:MAG: cytochrome oxidase subunit III [Bacteroidetes bacterium]|nr:MAG: cytochrome oxidase subunit III [Bacteroidota bacterium]REK32679.1 MAG: cytochrome oxidase subunit III [Bacteroidota bacterium]REK48874.1 MAG: cytochrome oxidase subunit III [Bacteroidota bacterium]